MGDTQLLQRTAVVMQVLWTFIGTERELWVKALEKFVQRQNPWPAKFPTWRTVWLGRFYSAMNYIYALRIAGVGMSKEFIEKLRIHDLGYMKRVELVLVSVEDLGFSHEGATLNEIIGAAYKHGLNVCTQEEAPALLLSTAIIEDELFLSMFFHTDAIWNDLYVLHRTTSRGDCVSVQRLSKEHRFPPTTRFIFARN